MSLDNSEIYAGIAGAELPVENFAFGSGVVVRKTYAHVMAPYLAAFAPAPPGQPHPPPWKAVSGGFGVDVKAELHIPLAFQPAGWFDRLNTVWWLVALMRFKGASLATVPVVADTPFASIPETEEEPHFLPIETEPHRLLPVASPPETLDTSCLGWIRDHRRSAGSLMNENEAFNSAFQAIDQSTRSRSTSLALVMLWGALERLFSPSKQELTFRVSATIASYLEPPGLPRRELYRSAKKLYVARSAAAHGAPGADHEAFVDTYRLLQRALGRMIERHHVPNTDELESFLFGEATVP